jgi:DNA (cytosine-5)-methyltransferase 1
MNFYNEIDPFAAAWLRELIKAGHIAPGVVDERSIEDITPDELKQYTQCHFFAGIGVWRYALRCAGWPDNRPVWTGSCPCQPFSTAGKRSGTSDERHLWPAFFHLIRECQPPTVFGEQVASKDGLAWLGTVSADLEGTGYTFGAADLCAAGFGAPHIRQRLYFMAHASNLRCQQQRDAAPAEIQGQCPERSGEHAQPGSEGQLSRGLEGLRGTSSLSLSRPLEHAEHAGLQGRLSRRPDSEREIEQRHIGCDRAVNGFWRGADFVYCRDGAYRPIESGTFPLVNGSPNSVGRLRGYGNAIVAPVAEAFISSAMEALDI